MCGSALYFLALIEREGANAKTIGYAGNIECRVKCAGLLWPDMFACDSRCANPCDVVRSRWKSALLSPLGGNIIPNDLWVSLQSRYAIGYSLPISESVVVTLLGILSGDRMDGLPFRVKCPLERV